MYVSVKRRGWQTGGHGGRAYGRASASPALHQCRLRIDGDDVTLWLAAWYRGVQRCRRRLPCMHCLLRSPAAAPLDCRVYHQSSDSSLRRRVPSPASSWNASPGNAHPPAGNTWPVLLGITATVLLSCMASAHAIATRSTPPLEQYDYVHAVHAYCLFQSCYCCCFGLSSKQFLFSVDTKHVFLYYIANAQLCWATDIGLLLMIVSGI